MTSGDIMLIVTVVIKLFNGQCSHRIETSHLMGFYMMGTLAVKGLSVASKNLDRKIILDKNMIKVS